MAQAQDLCGRLADLVAFRRFLPPAVRFYRARGRGSRRLRVSETFRGHNS